MISDVSCVFNRGGCFIYMNAEQIVMTKGEPFKLIFFFMVPVLIGNIFQQLYSIVDSMIVGQLLGVEAFAGVSVAAAVMCISSSLIMGFSGGFTIVLAQRFGRGSKPGVRRCVVTSVYIGAVVSAVITVVGILVSGSFLDLINTPDEVFEIARVYMVASCLGLPAMMAYNVFSGISRGLGDSKIPLYFLILTSILNVGFDYLAIAFLGLGVVGASVATTLGNVISSVLCAIYIFKKYQFVKPKRRDWKLSWPYVSRYIKLALPMALESSVTSFGVVFLQSAVNGFGADAVAGFSAASKMENILMVAFMALATAVSTYIAQNLGAKKIDRIVDGVRVNVVIGMGICLIFGVLMVVFWNQAIGLFVGDDEPEVVEAARQYINIAIASYPVLCLLITFRAIIQSLGNTVVPIFAGVSEVFVRSVGAGVLAALLGYVGACSTSILAWYSSFLILMVSYVFTINKLAKRSLAGN